MRVGIDHMRAILGPVGAIGDDCSRTDNRFRVGRQRHELRHRRIDPRSRPHARQAAQLRADQERVYPARIGGKLRVMQHHAAIAPVEVVIAEERADLRRRGAGTVGRATLPRRRIAGDAPAPGIGRLPGRTRPRVGQAVAGRDIHHHEWIKSDLKSARAQLLDQMRYAVVG